MIVSCSWHTPYGILLVLTSYLAACYLSGIEPVLLLAGGGVHKNQGGGTGPPSQNMKALDFIFFSANGRKKKEYK